MTDKKQALKETLTAAREAALVANAEWRKACDTTNGAAGMVARSKESKASDMPGKAELNAAIAVEDNARYTLHAAMAALNKALREAEDAGVET